MKKFLKFFFAFLATNFILVDVCLAQLVQTWKIGADYQKNLKDKVYSSQYCDENGANCADASSGLQREITWGDGLEYSEPTASVDYNTTNLKVTSTELNTIQDIATTSSPTFDSLDLTGTLTVDDIYEHTIDNGVNIEGNLLKDNEISTDVVNLDESYTVTGSEPVGSLFWDADFDTASLVTNNNIYQIGQELAPLYKNETGSTIYDGAPVVYAEGVGASGKLKITPAIADGTYEVDYNIGVATGDIATGSWGKVTSFGAVRNFTMANVVESGITLSVNDIVYVSATEAGKITNVKPDAPNQIITLGIVVNIAGINASLAVRPTWTNKLEDAYNVNGTALTIDGQILVWDNSNEYWDADYNVNDLGQWDRDSINGYIYPKTLTDSVGIGVTSPESLLDITDTSGNTQRWSYTNNSIYTQAWTDASGNFNLSPTNGSVILPQGSVSNPALALGDGDSGIYEDADDSISIATAGVQRFIITSGSIRGTAARAGIIANEVSSRTNPTLIPNRSNFTTGIGSESNTEMSLIVNGTEFQRITESTGIVNAEMFGSLDIMDSSNPQLRLTHTDNSIYSDFQLDSGGNLNINYTGSTLNINDLWRIRDGNIRPYSGDATYYSNSNVNIYSVNAGNYVNIGGGNHYSSSDYEAVNVTGSLLDSSTTSGDLTQLNINPTINLDQATNNPDVYLARINPTLTALNSGTLYGIKIEDISAVDSYAIYSTGTSPSHLGGNLDISGTSQFDNNITIGDGSAGIDYCTTYNGEDTDGQYCWDEDNDYFDFLDKVKFSAGAEFGAIGSNLILDDGSGDSPAIDFVGGSNDDHIYMYLDDDATSGDSDIAITLTDTTGDSKFIVEDSSNADKFVVDSSGLVGIGVASPSSQLEVDGNIEIQAGDKLMVNGGSYIKIGDAPTTLGTLYMYASAPSGHYEAWIAMTEDGSNPAKRFTIGSGAANPDYRWYHGTSGSETVIAILERATGYFGVGVADPTALVDVGGGSATSIDGVDDILVADDGEIDGDLYVEGFIQAANYKSGDGSQGITDNTSYWLCTAADCSTKCQVNIKDGLIVGCT